ncbi:UDP-N-acetylmuramoyl-tripeptide--D-alanyl-D-alanine ligase [Branchiibius sp. NY16-3462-2]|uniref:UDP-N-acetylmuramoyl-tripeptide--D-alanyl-D- alanine ligase n=1 Tax=Branchiibius sp. NY16-3462-2 TaxID=1807500 RepID=UPI00079295ED|nr:UDP-N-acetylmuramoyl-tripeptide--D-alanyl-D-alanine ligase [Branchiibius sp. NY16-3462-2]KYH43958.1 UDP-N-acetylmuramoyl-tripeptide--D-alanyl-D-alanine ligase [Branchiibius sp. NY16-3462-2]
MIPLSLAQIAHAIDAELVGPGAGDVVVDGPVVIDSRLAAPGSLYVARIGEHADGHQFAPAAAAAGAVAVLGLRPIDGVPTLVVADVQDAFARLARFVIDQLPDLRIIGITGSSGKTSTKDLLAQVLATQGPTVAPVGSFNSEVGVPLTVCRVTPDTRYLVAEMGADGVGHIAYLTRIAPPSIGIVLNVGTAHLAGFGSVEAIASTKSELVAALPAGGLAILNADDERVRAMQSVTDARVLLVGTSADAELRASDITLDEAGRPHFLLHGFADGPVPIALSLAGGHQVGNALAVLGAARELGVPAEQALAAVQQAGPVSRWRMEIFDLPGRRRVVNDAYNANPDSMAAALRAVAAMAAGSQRRTIAVLGQMLELGDSSQAAHEQVGRLAGQVGIDVLVAVGPGAEPIGAAAQDAGVSVRFVPDVDAAHDLVSAMVEDGDVVLFKSSRDSGLRYLGDRIITEAGGVVPQ